MQRNTENRLYRLVSRIWCGSGCTSKPHGINLKPTPSLSVVSDPSLADKHREMAGAQAHRREGSGIYHSCLIFSDDATGESFGLQVLLFISLLMRRSDAHEFLIPVLSTLSPTSTRLSTHSANLKPPYPSRKRWRTSISKHHAS